MSYPTFYDQVNEERAFIISVLQSVVSEWTEHTMEEGNEPLVEDFTYEYPEWRYDEIRHVIEKEMKRIESIILRDRQKVETPAQW